MSRSYSITQASHRLVHRGLPVLQRTLFVVGLVLVAVYVSSVIHASVSSRLAMWAFAAARESQDNQTPAITAASMNDGANLSFWSLQRIAAYKSSLALASDLPLAVLSIPRLRLTAPIFEGTDNLTLNRGLGRIRGTAALAEDGNVGIAGHRDGFFRELRDVALGDAIEITTTHGRDLYMVDRIDIVDPSDIGVLKPGDGAELTLITCYPFYFVGDAPRRYVVQASLKERSLQPPVRLIASAHLEPSKEK